MNEGYSLNVKHVQIELKVENPRVKTCNLMIFDLCPQKPRCCPADEDWSISAVTKSLDLRWPNHFIQLKNLFSRGLMQKYRYPNPYSTNFALKIKSSVSTFVLMIALRLSKSS